MERPASIFLSSIMSEARRAETEKQVRKKQREQLRARTEELFQQAMGLLERCGEIRKKKITVGKPEGEIVSYLVTPPTQVEEASLRVVEKIDRGVPGGYVYRDTISIKARFAEEQEMRLFQINRHGHNGVINWLGEKATLEQIGMVSAIVSFLEESLPEVPRTRQRESELSRGRIGTQRAKTS